MAPGKPVHGNAPLRGWRRDPPARRPRRCIGCLSFGIEIFLLDLYVGKFRHSPHLLAVRFVGHPAWAVEFRNGAEGPAASGASIGGRGSFPLA